MQQDSKKSSSKTEPVINGKVLYSPKGAAREYAAVGCNIYTGCKHDCEYCYLKRGVLSKALGGTEVKLKTGFRTGEDAELAFIREANKHLEYLQKVGVFFSFTTDPLIKETRTVTKNCLIHARQLGIPVKLLTKNADFLEDDKFMSILEKMQLLKAKIAFGFTLTGHDEMEPNASTNAQRIEAMRNLKERGFKTFASIEPIIDFNSSFDMIQQSAKFCDLFKIGLRSGVKDSYYKPEECAYFMGKVTALCEKEGFKVYWKESIRKYMQKHDNGDNFMAAFKVSANFVSMDFNLFKTE